MLRIALWIAVVGCGGSGAAPADPPADTSVANDGPFVVSDGPFVPATIRFRTGEPLASFGACDHDGGTVAYGASVIVDDCVECQCTTYGLRCRKRASCPDDRCVFVDGQAVPRGGSTVVDTCFECVCGDQGAACRRRLDAPCPVDGCRLADEELGFGIERFVSECHRCTCDPDAGLRCENVCHPTCSCLDGDPSCEQVCTELTCPVHVPDQDRLELSCGSMVCDYGSLVGC